MFLAVLATIGVLIGLQFRGFFAETTQLTLVTPRAGLVLDPGSKVTLNGVPIGRVTRVAAVEGDPVQQARVTLAVQPGAVALIPANVDARIQATTVFGNKYVALRSPKNPSAEPVSSATPIVVAGVTTEFNTLFETITSVSEQVDPVRLNQTLSAAAQALGGLGDRFGRSLVDGNAILADLNPRMPALRYDTRRLADLADRYTAAAPDLFDGLGHAATTARAFTDHRGDVDAALMAAIGFAGTAADTLERGGPYLVRGAADLLPTSQLFDDYQGMIFCTIRNYHEAAPGAAAALGGANGYSLQGTGSVTGVPNPYVYPDNLPRVNARGGPEGRPGCWQKTTRDLWPVPYLVTDTGLSIAPYNHAEIPSPMFVEYVWGRQLGEPTINP